MVHTTRVASGMEKVLRGVIRYRNTYKANMVKQFQQVRDNPHPTAVFFTCMDSRMLPTRFTQTNVGDMFIVRNAGNLVPHATKLSPDSVTTEPAALELGCVISGVKHVIVCGHSDCKAMNLLYGIHNASKWENSLLQKSPLRAWMYRHGYRSLERYSEVEKAAFKEPLLLTMKGPEHKTQAYIDVDDKFNETDKLSQVNTLVQLENVASHAFMAGFVKDPKCYIHAMWFDIYTGEIYYFSRKSKCFVPILDDNVESLLLELDNMPKDADTVQTAAEHVMKAAKDKATKHEKKKAKE